MENNRIHVHLTKNWDKGDPHILGTFFDGYKKLETSEARSIIAELKQPASIVEHLKRANGFFSIISSDGFSGWMAVDRIRSHPLFYGVRENKLYISDDARWVKERTGAAEMDPVSHEEFLIVGYVTGNNTLFKEVKQVQAGEVAFFTTDDQGRIVLEPQRYFCYTHTEYFEKNEDELHAIYDEVLTNVFRRLITYADGRKIAIPLSGGYDSRLVAIMLKNLGYDNLLAFTYGRPGNKEASFSKAVANALGIEWEFVPYTDELWRQWYESSEMEECRLMSDGLSSLSHIQDWSAVKVLREEGVFPLDCVFVPAHSADLLAGSRSGRVPQLYTEDTTKEDLIKAICDYHYVLKKWSNTEGFLKPLFKEKIERSLAIVHPHNSSAFESWDVSERQAKFIVNSIRVYEYFGFDWWLPFWESEYFDFWSRIKPENRLNEWFHIEHVNKKANSMGLVLSTNTSSRSKAYKFAASIAKALLPRKIKNTLKKRVQKANPLALFGCFPESEVDLLLDQGYSINGILAYYHVKRLEEEFAGEEDEK